jgi:hypothetical protein
VEARRSCIFASQKILRRHPSHSRRRASTFTTPSTTKKSMKFAKAVLSSLLLVSQNAVSAAAWAPASKLSTRRLFLASQQLHSVATSSISTSVVGTEQTESFRLAFKDQDKAMSPWHDIPLKNDDGTYNMVRRKCPVSALTRRETRCQCTPASHVVALLLSIASPSFTLFV